MGNNQSNLIKTGLNSTLRAVFNKRNAKYAVAIGLMVDLAGYSGDYGGRLLRTNSLTAHAAPYYEGLGKVMNFGWKCTKDLASGLHNIVVGHNKI